MISVIQGTKVAVSPAGIGLNLSVGEVLDPINDLTDWFDIRKKIDRLGTKMERFTADALYLMVVFIFQAIFIPMLTLWLLIKSITILHPTPRPRAAAED